MASLSSLRSQKARYVALKSKVNETAKYLSKAVDSLEPASDNIFASFNINDDSADLNMIKNHKQQLTINQKYLSGTIISAINSKIASLNRQIDAEIERMLAESQAADSAQ